METILDTILLFPSLARAIAVEVPDDRALIPWLRAQETSKAGSGRKAAARLVLSWFGCAPVDLEAAWSRLDDAHRAAVIKMLSTPMRTIVDTEGEAIDAKFRALGLLDPVGNEEPHAVGRLTVP